MKWDIQYRIKGNNEIITETEIEKIILLVLSLFSLSLFLGLILDIIRGFIDGYFDAKNGKPFKNIFDENDDISV